MTKLCMIWNKRNKKYFSYFCSLLPLLIIQKKIITIKEITSAAAAP